MSAGPAAAPGAWRRSGNLDDRRTYLRQRDALPCRPTRIRRVADSTVPRTPPRRRDHAERPTRCPVTASAPVARRLSGRESAGGDQLSRRSRRQLFHAHRRRHPHPHHDQRHDGGLHPARHRHGQRRGGGLPAGAGWPPMLLVRDGDATLSLRATVRSLRVAVGEPTSIDVVLPPAMARGTLAIKNLPL